MTADDGEDRRDGPGLTSAELRRRASGGAAVLMVRAAVVMMVGLVANVALARLLTPRDFGLVALGAAVLVFATMMSETGLGAGLIRRADAPSDAELRAVNALQFALAVAVVTVAAAVGAAIGRDGLVVAVMLAGLPVATLKAPSVILLERRLDYGVIARVDVIEALTFYVWAIGTVALGAGVWGFATAAVARAFAGAIAMARLGPRSLMLPRWSWAHARPVLAFGAKFQGAVVVNLLRDQALNVGIAVVAGVATLGVWNLAWRVLQVPLMAFGNLGRVAFPAMARLVEGGADPRSAIERIGASVAVLSAVVLVALVGFAPAVPDVVGPGWEDVPAVLLGGGLTLLVSFPVVIACSPYLFAADNGGTVILAAALGAVVWLGVALPLVPSLGAPAAAVGWAAGAVVQLALLASRTADRSGASLVRTAGAPIAIGIAAAVTAWIVSDAAGRGVGAGLLGVVAGEAALLVALAVLCRAALRETRGFVMEARTQFRGGSAR